MSGQGDQSEAVRWRLGVQVAAVALVLLAAGTLALRVPDLAVDDPARPLEPAFVTLAPSKPVDRGAAAILAAQTTRQGTEYAAELSAASAHRQGLRAAILALGVGFLTSVGLLVRWRGHQETATRNRHDATVSLMERRDARFATAIEHLANERESVQIGGVYTLEALAKDDPDGRSETVVRVLTAFTAEDRSRRGTERVPGSDFAISESGGSVHHSSELIEASCAAAVRARFGRVPLGLAEAALAGADLVDANLAEAILVGAHLEGADLAGANLTDAELSNANLVRATLTRANLTGAILNATVLAGANLTDANLSGANLCLANLCSTHLRGANLTGANLNSVTVRFPQDYSWGSLLHVRHSKSGADLQRVNLTGATLVLAQLKGSNLAGANLTGANLDRADLRGTNLTGADLTGTDLNDANLTGANLDAARGIGTHGSHHVLQPD